eukprot:scaffold3410_cov141-Cylindrotheca_fusiformis.AAC.22
MTAIHASHRIPLLLLSVLQVFPLLAGAEPVHLYGVNYNARNGPDSAWDKCKFYDQIYRELTILKRITNRVRLLSIGDCGQGVQVLEIARELGMQVWLGMWVGEEEYHFENEKGALADLISFGLIDSNTVLGVTVGSESIYREEVTTGQNIGYMEQAKGILSNGGFPQIPVSIAEIAPSYSAYSNLRSEVDVIVANIFPFWEGVPINGAINDMVTDLNWVMNLPESQGKELVIGETGWPSKGFVEGVSVASPENQVQFFINFYCEVAQGLNWKYYWFTAINNEWRQEDEDRENDVEGSFGFLNADMTLKSNFQDLTFTCASNGIEYSFSEIDWDISTVTAAPATVPAESCRAHQACADLGLFGNCCPTDGANGVFLGCCDTTGGPPPPTPTPTTAAPQPTKDPSPGPTPFPTFAPVTSDPSSSPVTDAPVTPPPTRAPVVTPPPTSASIPAESCAANSRCFNLQLAGNCCPTRNGVFLDCCDPVGGETTPPPTPSPVAPNAPITPTPPPTPASIPSERCSAHSACYGLVGNCCPTPSGLVLDCCNKVVFETTASPTNSPVLPNAPTPSPNSASVPVESCEANSACFELGLVGSCCPTRGPNGMFLDCCDEPSYAASSETTSPTGSAVGAAQTGSPTRSPVQFPVFVSDATLVPDSMEPSSAFAADPTDDFVIPTLPPFSASIPAESCEANIACANLGLAGNCCPTSGPNGVFLLCCDTPGPVDGSAPSTLSPTRFPTFDSEATLVPTKLPSFPTVSPTAAPVTPPPSAAPVSTATPPPTTAPVTPPPTIAPVTPSIAPVTEATLAPVTPTNPPVTDPTFAPVTPTNPPVTDPTIAPVTPTNPPVTDPTIAPVTPTNPPVTDPTIAPVTPSIAPVTDPTIAPVAPPPSQAPTDAPVTAAPTSDPTTAPVTPDQSPSPVKTPYTPPTAPSAAPSETMIVQTLTGLSVTLFGLTECNQSCQDAFVRQMVLHFESFFSTTSIDLLGNTPEIINVAFVEGEDRRNLEEEGAGVQITYDHTFAYTADSPVSVDQLATTPLAFSSLRADFVEDLKGDDSASFQDLESISEVTVSDFVVPLPEPTAPQAPAPLPTQPSTPPPTQAPTGPLSPVNFPEANNSPEGEIFSLGTVIGIAVGGTLLVLICLFCFVMNRRRRNEADKSEGGYEPPADELSFGWSTVYSSK